MKAERLECSTYHSLLRISLCVFAFLLIFDSGLLYEGTAQISQGAQHYVATAVGVKVSIPENDVNILTTRITELENELAAKDREIAVAQSGGGGEAAEAIDMSTFILSIILFILLVLILMNYILDYLRYRPIDNRQTLLS